MIYSHEYNTCTTAVGNIQLKLNYVLYSLISLSYTLV